MTLTTLVTLAAPASYCEPGLRFWSPLTAQCITSCQECPPQYDPVEDIFRAPYSLVFTRQCSSAIWWSIIFPSHWLCWLEQAYSKITDLEVVFQFACHTSCLPLLLRYQLSSPSHHISVHQYISTVGWLHVICRLLQTDQMYDDTVQTNASTWSSHLDWRKQVVVEVAAE